MLYTIILCANRVINKEDETCSVLSSNAREITDIVVTRWLVFFLIGSTVSDYRQRKRPPVNLNSKFLFLERLIYRKFLSHI